mgnify:CR=1 FL=1
MARASKLIAFLPAFLWLSGLPACGNHDHISGDAENEDIISELEGDTILDILYIENDEAFPHCDTAEDCDDLDPCTADSCDMDTGLCSNSLVDVDGDGHPASSVDGVDCPGDDCDDLDPLTYPGADEICNDNKDEDCDNVIDGPVFLIDPVVVASTVAEHEHPIAYIDMCWSGSDFGLTWHWDYSPTWGISSDTYFLRFTEIGAKRGEAITITSGGWPKIVWADGNYFISSTHSTGESIYSTVVDPFGSMVIDVQSVVNAGYSDIVWDGSHIAVSYTDFDDDPASINFIRLDTAGIPIESGIQIYQPDSLDYTLSSVAFNGYDYLISMPGIDFVIVNAYGISTFGPVRVSSTFQYEPSSVVWSGDNYIISWPDFSSIPTRTLYRYANADGSTSPEMSFGPGDSAASILFAGTIMLSSWYYGDGTMSIVSQFDEVPLNSIQLTHASSYIYPPAVAWSGNVLAISWLDYTNIPEYRILFTILSFCN